MELHNNARSCPASRVLLVRRVLGGMPVTGAASAAGVSKRKAERFIQTLLREWAYKRPYSTSAQRTDRLPPYLNHYNLRRPHAALNKRTPAQRLSEQPVEN